VLPSPLSPSWQPPSSVGKHSVVWIHTESAGPNRGRDPAVKERKVWSIIPIRTANTTRADFRADPLK
jgi:hypothetical protein